MCQCLASTTYGQAGCVTVFMLTTGGGLDPFGRPRLRIMPPDLPIKIFALRAIVPGYGKLLCWPLPDHWQLGRS